MCFYALEMARPQALLYVDLTRSNIDDSGYNLQTYAVPSRVRRGDGVVLGARSLLQAGRDAGPCSPMTASTRAGRERYARLR